MNDYDEEEFPSLNGQWASYPDMDKENCAWMDESRIKKHTVDKQRVREAIQHREIDENGSLVKGLPKQYAQDLIERLGL